MYLVRCGVPFEIAFGLDEAERLAFIVTMGTLEGHRFDWTALRWRDEEAGGRG
ncbi:hypothetical protein [Acidocella facilis]|uniref:hypothetical protein n=1 Tax=Acidocella facilis TaxID=525 RepID=UPI001B803A80|nr:hypothetical protein [Acidocella facilis]